MVKFRQKFRKIQNRDLNFIHKIRFFQIPSCKYVHKTFQIVCLLSTHFIKIEWDTWIIILFVIPSSSCDKSNFSLPKQTSLLQNHKRYLLIYDLNNQHLFLLDYVSCVHFIHGLESIFSNDFEILSPKNAFKKSRKIFSSSWFNWGMGMLPLFGPNSTVQTD